MLRILSELPVGNRFWIIEHAPSSFVTTSVDHIDITFSREVNDVTFTVDDIKVADAQDVVIDASTLVGWISVRNTKDHVNIINQESGEKAGFCGTACTTGKRPVQVPAGTYKLKFPNFEVDDIQVKAGEEVVVE